MDETNVIKQKLKHVLKLTNKELNSKLKSAL